MLAAQRMAQEQPGQALQPNALVHEVCPRQVGGEAPTVPRPSRFFAASAEASRRNGSRNSAGQWILLGRCRSRRRSRVSDRGQVLAKPEAEEAVSQAVAPPALPRSQVTIRGAWGERPPLRRPGANEVLVQADAERAAVFEYPPPLRQHLPQGGLGIIHEVDGEPAVPLIDPGPAGEKRVG